MKTAAEVREVQSGEFQTAERLDVQREHANAAVR